MFPLGQPLELSVTDADSSGVLQDPGGLSLIVEPPQGASTTYTYPGSITRDSQGTYSVVITPEVAGLWQYRWIATGAYAGATLLQSFLVQSSSIG